MIKIIISIIFSILIFTGCAKNQPDVTINNKPTGFWKVEERVCSNQYSFLDILPFRLVINGIGELVNDCEETDSKVATKNI